MLQKLINEIERFKIIIEENVLEDLFGIKKEQINNKPIK